MLWKRWWNCHIDILISFCPCGLQTVSCPCWFLAVKMKWLQISYHDYDDLISLILTVDPALSDNFNWGQQTSLGGLRAGAISLSARVTSARLLPFPTLRILHYSSTCYAGCVKSVSFSCDASFSQSTYVLFFSLKILWAGACVSTKRRAREKKTKPTPHPLAFTVMSRGLLFSFARLMIFWENRTTVDRLCLISLTLDWWIFSRFVW